MLATDDAFAQWLAEAQIAEDRLTAEQRALLQRVFAFRQRCGDDYYSSRLLSHFLLHCDSELKVAQIARLVGFSRPTASHQQGVSSKQAIQAAHHRMAGRPYGKLLPRYAGSIAEFLLKHPDATRDDVLDFIEGAWKVRVSKVALHHFCKKFGLDRATRAATASAAPQPAAPATPRQEPRPSGASAASTGRLNSATSSDPFDAPPRPTQAAVCPGTADRVPATPRGAEPLGSCALVPVPAPPFSRCAPNTRAPSC